MQPVKAPLPLHSAQSCCSQDWVSAQPWRRIRNDCNTHRNSFPPKFSDEDRSKWKGKSVTGRVAIVVSEEGDVTQARVVSASPKEAADSLLNAAKQAKSRLGWMGDLKTEVVLAQSVIGT